MFPYHRHDTPLSTRIIAHNINLTTPTRLPRGVKILEGIFVAVAAALATAVLCLGFFS